MQSLSKPFRGSFDIQNEMRGDPAGVPGMQPQPNKKNGKKISTVTMLSTSGSRCYENDASGEKGANDRQQWRALVFRCQDYELSTAVVKERLCTAVVKARFCTTEDEKGVDVEEGLCTAEGEERL